MTRVHRRPEVVQTGSLQIAFSKLHELQLTMQQVKRVAVERLGEIHIEVHEADRQRFFIFEANALRELQSENDQKIPFLVNRGEAGFAADYTIISYRPGRRVVLAVANNGPEPIIKAYRKHRCADAAGRHALALAACKQGGFEAPELLQYQADYDCLIMSKRPGEAPGVSLDATGTWELIGSGLRHFQQAPVTGEIQTFRLQDELDVLDERARRLLLCVPMLPLHWRAGCERLEDAVKYLPPAVNGLAHRDLHDGQFVVAGNSISLLDFDLICRADVALDAGNLLAHFRLRVLQAKLESGDAAVSGCSEAFLSGLGRQDEPGFEQRLLFYQATTFYRLALLYSLRPRWVHLTEPLIKAGKSCIDALDEFRGGP